MNLVLLDAAIRETREKISQLQGKHRSEVEFHRAAREQYGSEPCSGEILRGERKILGEISAVGATLKILLAVRDHGVDLPAKKEEIERSVASIDSDIAFLEKRLDYLRQKEKFRRAKLARINKALSLLS